MALAQSRLTAGQVATRVQALDFNFMGLLLPNPDPILKQTGKDIEAYRGIARDSHVGACIRRRKSAVKALQWGVDRAQAPARVAKAVTDMIGALDMERIIGNALDATLFGYAPMEIDWRAGTGGTLPRDVIALPPEWFCFDPDNALRFKTRTAPVYGELLPERKFLVPRQDATYQNPYGLGDLALCWWPVIFKKGGLKFWLAFTEKYGSAFALGKLPRGADAAERAALLSALEDMIQNAVAVIPDDGSVDLKEAAGKSASADLYERLVLHCRGEISIALLGTNQTVEKDAGKASAYAGMDVAEDLRDGDAELVAAAVNQLIKWTVELNWPGAAAPTFSLWDQEAKDKLQADRDRSNHEAGATFTKSFWVRNYGYQEDDLVDAPVAPAPGAPGTTLPALRLRAANAGPAFAQAQTAAAAAAPDPTAAELEALSAAAAPAWDALVGQLQDLVEAAPDLATLQRTLADAYGGLDTGDLVKLMAAAFALAEIKGIAAARSE
jgi:phage gp29-like protein